jgi:thiamine transport system permease protein
MALCCATLLGLLHAIWAHRMRLGRLSTFLPFMVSPVVMAFGLLVLYPDWTASLVILIGTYTLLAYPFVTKDVLSLLDSLPEQYRHASRNLGASAWQTQQWVVFPLIKPALRRGMTFAAATCIGEFAASLFLSRPEWMTLTTLIYQLLGRAGQENQQAAMVLSLVLMLLAGGIFLCLDDKYIAKGKKSS